jgi:hypothetical protein
MLSSSMRSIGAASWRLGEGLERTEAYVSARPNFARFAYEIFCAAVPRLVLVL